MSENKSDCEETEDTSRGMLTEAENKSDSKEAEGSSRGLSAEEHHKMFALPFGLGASIVAWFQTLKSFRPTAQCAGVGFVEAVPSVHGMDDKWITTTDYLFHYTTWEGVRKIEETRFIKISSGRGRDARFGNGVYLTSLHPEEGREKILKNNYDGRIKPSRKVKNNANYYFRFKKSDLTCATRMVDPVRDIWLCPHEIYLDHVDYVRDCIEANVSLHHDITGALTEINFTK